MPIALMAELKLTTFGAGPCCCISRSSESAASQSCARPHAVIAALKHAVHSASSPRYSCMRRSSVRAARLAALFGACSSAAIVDVKEITSGDGALELAASLVPL
eukprot:6176806-Pleurochrysis_carterae.AAC.2